MASQLCTCVFEGNLPLLRRLIAAGAPADVGDYDKRTALHIAASEGNTTAVSCRRPFRPCTVQLLCWRRALGKACSCCMCAFEIVRAWPMGLSWQQASPPEI